jgi:hypothetical protein
MNNADLAIIIVAFVAALWACTAIIYLCTECARITGYNRKLNHDAILRRIARRVVCGIGNLPVTWFVEVK